VKLRERTLEDLEALGHEAIDLGTDKTEPRIDYPDKALELGRAILEGTADRGILVCGSGWAHRSPPRRSPGSARRSATTSIRRTRA
jgi:ribose 5-phosphate isomerase RpiB